MKYLSVTSVAALAFIMGGCVLVDDGYGYGTTETVYYEESYYTPGNTVIYQDVIVPAAPPVVYAPPPPHHHGPGLHVRPDHRPPGHHPGHRPPGHREELSCHPEE